MKKRYRLKHRAASPHTGAPQQDEAPGSVATPSRDKPARETRAPSAGGAFWRGVALDLTVVVGQLFLLAPLARTLREGGQNFLAPGNNKDTVGGLVSPRVGWLFLAAFAAHAAGAFLKRLPRQSRLAAYSVRRAPLFREGALAGKIFLVAVCGLFLFHFMIFTMLLFTGWQSTPLESWSPLFGKTGVAGTYSEFFVRFVAIVFVMPLPTALVAINMGARAGSPLPPSWRTHPATEFVADLLLYFSIVVVTLVMNVIVAPRFVAEAGLTDISAGDALASLIPLALAFSFFYLPPRLVYLAEDYRSPVAWLTILLALLSLAYRTFTPASLSW